jgi:hypothetical protein
MEIRHSEDSNMADLAQTPANVSTSGGQTGAGTAGEALVGGEPLYQKASDGKIYRADANVTIAEATCIGIGLHPTNANQPIAYAKPGSQVNLGATLVKGEIYVVSHNVGKVSPKADLISAEFISILGIAKDTSILDTTLANNTGYTV